jgi:hypothetical protein
LKALLLVIAFSIVLLIALTLVFRAVTIQKRAVALLWAWIATVPALAAVYILTSPSLGFLPPSLIDSPAWTGLTFAVLLYFAAFFGGILQLYNLTERGFSLRILIDLCENPTGETTLEDVVKGYSRGRGMDWMYQKRLDGLIDQRLVVVDGCRIGNTARGRRIARSVDWARRFLQLGTWT